MSALLASLWSLLGQAAISVSSKLIGSFTVIIGNLENDERQILVDAKSKFLSDVQAGQSPEAAFADALTVFFNEQKGEISKVSLYLFKAFGAAFGVPMGN